MDEYGMSKERELTDNRNFMVSKSNSLIQKTRYDLTTQEQKIILYIISKIKPGQEAFTDYALSLPDLCRVCGIEVLGTNYIRFKDSIKSLADKSFWLKNDKQETLCRWIAKVRINSRSSTVEIRLDEDLKPYLLDLRENFTAYELENILVMKSKYSIRLYEILKSYCNIGFYDIDLDELRTTLMATYDRYDNFRRCVLDKAKEEINHYTDLDISYQPIRTGRKITGIHFDIKSKLGFNYSMASLRRNSMLNEGMTIDE